MPEACEINNLHEHVVLQTISDVTIVQGTGKFIPQIWPSSAHCIVSNAITNIAISIRKHEALMLRSFIIYMYWRLCKMLCKICNLNNVFISS